MTVAAVNGTGVEGGAAVSVAVGGTGVALGGMGVNVVVGGSGVGVTSGASDTGVAAGAPHPAKSNITNVTPIICRSDFGQLISHFFFLGNALANMGDIILTRISEKHQTYALFSPLS